MKICDFLENYLEEDVISKIYHNDFDFAEQEPKTAEYRKICKNMRQQEKELVHNRQFQEYLENRNIKESIEAEEQFKLGFKTAVKIILESYQ